jgi:hypothetical protein
MVISPPLHYHPSNKKHAEDSQQSNHTAVTPLILASFLLECNQKTYDACHEENCSNRVELSQDSPAFLFRLHLWSFRGEKNNDKGEGYGTDGEIDWKHISLKSLEARNIVL